MSLYWLVSSNTSNKNPQDSNLKTNERLEYLGDAILGAITADYLFKKYPSKDEGFLSKKRSYIVNRKMLNNIGKSIGMIELINLNPSPFHHQKKESLVGDTLEAFIGAVYLDKGYDFCKSFVTNKIINFIFNNIDLLTSNHKGILIEWANKNKKKVSFITEEQRDLEKQFTTNIMIGDELIATGKGTKKKSSQQNAALNALKIINLIC